MPLPLLGWNRRYPWLTPAQSTAEIGSLLPAIGRATDYRGRQKLARRLACAASSLAYTKEPLDISLVERGIEALRISRVAGGVTDDFDRAETFLNKTCLDLLGIRDVTTFRERVKRLA